MKQTLENFKVRIDAQGKELIDPETTMRQGDGFVYYGAEDEAFDAYEQATEVIKLPKLIEYCHKLRVQWAGNDITSKEAFRRQCAYMEFLETTLSLGQFIPVDKEGKPLEKPESFDDFILMTHNEFSRKYYIDNYINCEIYQTALDNVIFEGWELSYYDRNKTYHLIDNKGGCILVEHNGRKCFEIKGKPIKTINDALNADVPLYVKPENIEKLIK